MQCKKQLTFGKEALSDADCQGKLKRWLLAGLHHPDASRSWHVSLDARQLAGSSREDLDGELQAKLSEGCSINIPLPTPWSCGLHGKFLFSRFLATARWL